MYTFSTVRVTNLQAFLRLLHPGSKIRRQFHCSERNPSCAILVDLPSRCPFRPFSGFHLLLHFYSLPLPLLSLSYNPAHFCGPSACFLHPCSPLTSSFASLYLCTVVIPPSMGLWTAVVLLHLPGCLSPSPISGSSFPAHGLWTAVVLPLLPHVYSPSLPIITFTYSM